MGRVRAPVADRIARARQRAGLDCVAVAHQLGMSAAAYDDLEANDDDAFMSISLGQLCSLGQLLNISPRTLIAPEGATLNPERISFVELVDRMRQYMRVHSLSVEQFEDRVGWEVSGPLQNPETAWKDWNLDGLQDICALLGVDWLLALPGTPSNPLLQGTRDEAARP